MLILILIPVCLVLVKINPWIKFNYTDSVFTTEYGDEQQSRLIKTQKHLQDSQQSWKAQLKCWWIRLPALVCRSHAVTDEHGMGSLARPSLLSALRKGVRSARLNTQTLVHCKCTVGLTRALRGAALRLFSSPQCSFPEAAAPFLVLSEYFCLFCSARVGLVVFYVMFFEVHIKCGCNLKGHIVENSFFFQ